MSKFDEARQILVVLREYDNGDNTFLPITLGEVSSIDKALELGKLYEELSSLLLIQRQYNMGSQSYYELDNDINDIKDEIVGLEK